MVAFNLRKFLSDNNALAKFYHNIEHHSQHGGLNNNNTQRILTNTFILDADSHDPLSITMNWVNVPKSYGYWSKLGKLLREEAPNQCRLVLKLPKFTLKAKS